MSEEIAIRKGPFEGWEGSELQLGLDEKERGTRAP